MPKTLIFLAGFLIGPVSLIVFFFVLGEWSKPAWQREKSSHSGQASTADMEYEKITRHLTVRLKMSPAILGNPLLTNQYLGLVISTSTNPWENDEIVQAIPIGKINSIPFDLSLDLSIKQALLKSNRTFRQRQEHQELVFTFMLGSKPMDDLFNGKTASVNLDPRRPLNAYRTEVFYWVPKNPTENTRRIHLGDVYFREFYRAPPLAFQCPEKLTTKLKLFDPSGRLRSMLNGKTAHLVRAHDEWYWAMGGGMKISRAINDNAFASLYQHLGPISLENAGLESEVPTKNPETAGFFYNYYLLLCDKLTDTKACLEKFGEGIFKNRKFVADGEYYPLIPNNLAVPSCDSPNLQLIFYPLKAQITAPNQFLVNQKSSKIPTEIIDSLARH